MKLIVPLLAAATFLACGRGGVPRAEPVAGPRDTLARDTLLLIGADTAAGFHFPYYLYIPEGTVSGPQHLLVETNNTGPNDTLAAHVRGAAEQVTNASLGSSLSWGLKVPFLMPAFPRPRTAWPIYTHALDRDAVLLDTGAMQRLDRQLIAMIEDARPRLQALGYAVHDQVLLNGFSASGTFANRFTLLHPERVAAVACGGINSIAMLPVDSLNGAALDYPLGTHDAERLFSRPLDTAAFKRVPQLLYMGALDDNDAVDFDDAYARQEREVVHTAIGRAMADRWTQCRTVYVDQKVNASFRIYPGIGHATDRMIYKDVMMFFRAAMAGE